IHGQALPGGDLSARDGSTLLLEWGVLSGAEARPVHVRRGDRGAGAKWPRTAEPVPLVRPALLPDRRHPGQSGPHEHGPFARSAAAVSGPPPRRIRRLPARAVEDSGP